MFYHSGGAGLAIITHLAEGHRKGVGVCGPADWHAPRSPTAPHPLPLVLGVQAGTTDTRTASTPGASGRVNKQLSKHLLVTRHVGSCFCRALKGLCNASSRYHGIHGIKACHARKCVHGTHTCMHRFAMVWSRVQEEGKRGWGLPCVCLPSIPLLMQERAARGTSGGTQIHEGASGRDQGRMERGLGGDRMMMVTWLWPEGWFDRTFDHAHLSGTPRVEHRAQTDP